MTGQVDENKLFVPKYRVNNNPAFPQILAWRPTVYKPLPLPGTMIVQCVNVNVVVTNVCIVPCDELCSNALWDTHTWTSFLVKIRLNA